MPEIPWDAQQKKGKHTTEFERDTFATGLGHVMSGQPVCHQCGVPVPSKMVVDHIPPSEILREVPADVLEDAGIYGDKARQTTNHQCDQHRAEQGGHTRVIVKLAKRYKELKAQKSGA